MVPVVKNVVIAFNVFFQTMSDYTQNESHIDSLVKCKNPQHNVVNMRSRTSTISSTSSCVPGNKADRWFSKFDEIYRDNKPQTVMHKIKSDMKDLLHRHGHQMMELRNREKTGRLNIHQV